MKGDYHQNLLMLFSVAEVGAELLICLVVDFVAVVGFDFLSGMWTLSGSAACTAHKCQPALNVFI